MPRSYPRQVPLRWSSMAGFFHPRFKTGSARSDARLAVNDILLDATVEGDRLRLAGNGAWISQNAGRLESQVDRVTRRYKAVKHVEIDMGQIERLDTFGAWLLERLLRAFTARGAQTQVRELRDDYRALMDELHAIKPLDLHRKHSGGLIEALAAVGKSVTTVGARFIGIVNMLGALVVALL